VGVSLRRRERRETEDLLDRAQVRAALEKVGRGGVPQSVGREVGDSRDRGDAVRDLAHLAHVDAAPAPTEEERRARARADEPGPAPVEPRTERAGRRDPERHDPLTAALARDAQGVRVEIDVLAGRTDELA